MPYFKEGVFMDNTSSHVLHAFVVIDIIHEKWTGTKATVTSIEDGKHKRLSKHYEDNALDMRIWALERSRLPAFVDDLEEALGNLYDVVLEHDHIHIEWDPD